jgi:hypothetical protein
MRLGCVLLGCHAPVVLREVASSLPDRNTKAHYLFIGGRYVYSMKEELIEALDRGELAT